MSISNMGSVPIKMMLFLILQLWFIQYVSPSKTYDQRPIRHSGRSLLSDSDFMNIDCGAPKDYYDNQKRYFDNDTKYINTGEVSQVSLEFLTKDLWPQFKYLRSFPKGKRNCYTLPLKQGKNVNYLITAFFKYGNYDNKATPPEFDLYIGVNRWRTLKTIETIFSDVIYLATTDSVDLCLVNTNSGTPFISALQLRPLVSDSFYQTGPNNLLRLIHRFDCGTPFGDYFNKYYDDVYVRTWEQTLPVSNSISSWTSSQSDFVTVYDEQPAPTVLKTYVQPTQQGTWMNYYFNKLGDPTSEFAVYLHFAGVLQSSSQAQRRFSVTINGNVDGPFNFPEYMKTLYVSRNTSVTGNVHINISATDGSQFSPILNALEIFMVVPIPDSPSNQEDVTAMMEIKRTYGVTEESWQGDPCVPKEFSWSKVGCNSDKPPRIISLDLSSSGLTGDITPSISNLKSIRVLDLSYNNLTGSIPESLAELSSLEVLNLAGNKLEGSVPKALLEKSNARKLNLSLHDNPTFCFPNPCKHKKNKAIIIVVVAVAILVVAMVLLLVCFCKRIRQGVIPVSFKNKWSCKPRSQQFRYSDLVKITNNFESCLGEGGFGKVYQGKLNGTKVAVKLRSPKSTQGPKEFQNEVNTLMGVKHKNLVSLIGYCNEKKNSFENKYNMAVIYEYMANGNLKQHISPDANSVIPWKKRLQIAVDAAQGLKYLHEDLRNQIVHRDLKTSNILLNDKFEAKISDFGLSKALSNDTTTTTEQGSNDPGSQIIGYLAPEFENTRKLDKKSDIYSFGVILLELITGKEARMKISDCHIHISVRVTPLYDEKKLENIVDERVPRATYKTDSAWKAIDTAMTCINSDPNERKDMKWVLQELEEALKIQNSSEGTQSNNNLMVNNSNEIVSSERPNTN